MATIKKTRNQTWAVRYEKPTGGKKRRQGTATFKKYADAQAFKTQNDAAILTGTYIDPRAARLGFGTWAERWLDTRTNLKPKTAAGYESLLRVHILPRFADTPLNAIDPLDVETFVAELTDTGLSPSRTRQAHQLLSMIFKAAVRSRRIAFNPAEGISLPRANTRQMKFLDSDEGARLAEAIPDRYAAWAYVASYGGLRWGELAGLKRKRVNLLRRRLHIEETLSDVRGELFWTTPKNHQSRDVALPGFVCDLLASHLERYAEADPDALVFTTDSGTPLRAPNFRRNVWLPATSEAGLDGLTPHHLRHTCAAMLISEGAHPRQVMEQLGHSSIAVTMNTYGKVFPDDMDSLADRLEQRHRAQNGTR
jgi:integrase